MWLLCHCFLPFLAAETTDAGLEAMSLPSEFIRVKDCDYLLLFHCLFQMSLKVTLPVSPPLSELIGYLEEVCQSLACG